ncbi:unnamed protein product [Meganyctiphanes norvegica]|uniref:Lipoxygenase n=1 Tax=Meganyctiphanes norvegica TaxID=48144 RepID=A0AAV2QBX5_MEGNR
MSRKSSLEPVKDFVRDMMVSISPKAHRPEYRYQVNIVTGDRRGAGTDANVYIVLHDLQGNTSNEITPNKIFSNEHERGTTTSVNIGTDCGVSGPIYKVEIWRDNFCDIGILGSISNKITGQRTKRCSAVWFLDRVEVVEVGTQIGVPQEEDVPLTVHSEGGIYRKWVFPVQRWIAANKHYLMQLHDCLLPQYDPNVELRRQEIIDKRVEYVFIVKFDGGPAQVENLPGDEKFSEEYYWNFATQKAKLLAETKWMEWTNKTKWNSLNDLKSVYKKSLGEPQCINVWREDWWFGLQRLQGVNPQVIELCTQIPENLDVSDTTVEGLLDELTLNEALEAKKIFICNLQILDGIICKDNRELAAPMALFYLNKEEKLLPIAIQLKQKKGDDNPVFTPRDSANTWLVAKMFYNNAEAQHHQAMTHLGYTHLLMEGVVVCTHRNLSPSHPLFKLMAPHFLFLLAINSRGLEKLVSEGGWVDCCMTQGLCGILDLMKRGFDQWTYTKFGSVASEVGARGVLDKDVLPYYPYRDDALPLFDHIKNYVRTVVDHHYDSEEKLKEDWELKNWREELTKPRNENGVGLKEIPGSEEGFNNVEEVVDVLTMIISTCSLGHAASNFQQYEQYGYVPNYPGIIMSELPKEKIEYTEEKIMQILPDKRMTLDIMVITKLLSSKGTKSLGDFEMQYLYDPVGVKAAEEFRKNLDRLSKEIELLNVDRQWKFEWLDPKYVPNSISV